VKKLLTALVVAALVLLLLACCLRVSVSLVVMYYDNKELQNLRRHNENLRLNCPDDA
jgi:cell division protein FtsL